MIDMLVERLATTTEQLVSFPTVARDPAALQHCVEWTRAHMLKHAPRLHARTFVSNGKPSLLCYAGETLPRLLLSGHLDVVEAVHPGAFTATQDDSMHLRGRGTADMKGPVAALLDVMEHDPLPGLGLLLTTDEEIGGQDGTAYVLQQLPEWRPEVVVMPDGGANMRLVTEQKGVLRLRLEAEGVAAHGSRPWLGINAIDRVYAAYKKLLRKYPIPAGEEDWRVSITLSQLYGGDTVNAVPHKAEATLDIRFPQILDAAKLALSLRKLLAPLGVAAHVQKVSPAFRLDVEDPAVRQLQQAARDTYGQPLPEVREAGASDAHWYAPDDVPVLLFQPECAEWHGADEWVALPSLAMFRSTLATFTRAYLGRERATSRRRALAGA